MRKTPQTLEYFREYRRRNIVRRREIERKSELRPERREKKRKYNQEYQKTHIEFIRAKRKRFPERNRARWKLKYEVRMGRIKRLPCEKCGAEPSEAHHPDYSRPLDVMWLCRKHHIEIEVKTREKKPTVKHYLSSEEVQKIIG